MMKRLLLWTSLSLCIELGAAKCGWYDYLMRGPDCTDPDEEFDVKKDVEAIDTTRGAIEDVTAEMVDTKMDDNKEGEKTGEKKAAQHNEETGDMEAEQHDEAEAEEDNGEDAEKTEGETDEREVSPIPDPDWIGAHYESEFEFLERFFKKHDHTVEDSVLDERDNKKLAHNLDLLGVIRQRHLDIKKEFSQENELTEDEMLQFKEAIMDTISIIKRNGVGEEMSHSRDEVTEIIDILHRGKLAILDSGTRCGERVAAYLDEFFLHDKKKKNAHERLLGIERQELKDNEEKKANKNGVFLHKFFAHGENENLVSGSGHQTKKKTKDTMQAKVAKTHEKKDTPESKVKTEEWNAHHKENVPTKETSNEEQKKRRLQAKEEADAAHMVDLTVTKQDVPANEEENAGKFTETENEAATPSFLTSGRNRSNSSAWSSTFMALGFLVMFFFLFNHALPKYAKCRTFSHHFYAVMDELFSEHAPYWQLDQGTQKNGLTRVIRAFTAPDFTPGDDKVAVYERSHSAGPQRLYGGSNGQYQHESKGSADGHQQYGGQSDGMVASVINKLPSPQHLRMRLRSFAGLDAAYHEHIC